MQNVGSKYLNPSNGPREHPVANLGANKEILLLIPHGYGKYNYMAHCSMYLSLNFAIQRYHMDANRSNSLFILVPEKTGRNLKNVQAET